MTETTTQGLSTVPGLDLDLPEDMQYSCYGAKKTDNNADCNDYPNSDFINYWRDNDKFGELSESLIYSGEDGRSTCVMRFNAD
jgi:hypothetical protein